MPKHESLTPKAIANRIKSKGLQKLRWYCEMCQKQCRDENGFKCHTMSESHQRQLLLFAENPEKYIDHFSQEFYETFVALLKRRFNTKRVFANQVYQEYIADRTHLHMNATQWETLTDFVKWLGREGHCTVDQTEKGWFIAYIDRDPETIRRQEALAKKEKMDLTDAERNAKFLQRQIERGKNESKVASTEVKHTELMKDENEKVEFALPLPPAKKELLGNLERKENPLLRTHSSKAKNGNTSSEQKKDSGKKRSSALDDLMKEQEISKEKVNRKDYWLAPGIVVKIVTKQLGEKYFKKKAVVTEVKDKYVGMVQTLDPGDMLKLDQKHLETVIPAIGRKLLIVNGAYRGQEAILRDIVPEKFSVKIEINSGPLRGRTVENIQYEDVCKLHNQS